MNAAPPGTFGFTLRLGYRNIGWTERYNLLSGTLSDAQQSAMVGGWLRSWLFGAGVEVVEASVSDLSGTRLSLPVPINVVPFGNPKPDNFPNDSAAGLLYRLQWLSGGGTKVGWFENRVLRGIQDAWIGDNTLQIAPPLGIDPANPGVMPSPNYLTIPPNVLSLGTAALDANKYGANLFIAWLVTQTQYVQYPRTEAQAANGRWANATFYRVTVRRAGHRYQLPKGRFSR